MNWIELKLFKNKSWISSTILTLWSYKLCNFFLLQKVDLMKSFLSFSVCVLKWWKQVDQNSFSAVFGCRSFVILTFYDDLSLTFEGICRQCNHLRQNMSCIFALQLYSILSWWSCPYRTVCFTESAHKDTKCFFKLKWTFYLNPSVCWVKVEIDHNIVATCKCLNVETLLFMFFVQKTPVTKNSRSSMSSVFSSLNIDRAAKMIYEIFQSDRYLLVCLLKNTSPLCSTFFLLSTDVNLLEITLMMLFGMGPHKAAELTVARNEEHLNNSHQFDCLDLSNETLKCSRFSCRDFYSDVLLHKKTQKKTSSSLWSFQKTCVINIASFVHWFETDNMTISL